MFLDREEVGLTLWRDPLLHRKCPEISHTNLNAPGAEMEEARGRLGSASQVTAARSQGSRENFIGNDLQLHPEGGTGLAENAL